MKRINYGPTLENACKDALYFLEKHDLGHKTVQRTLRKALARHTSYIDCPNCSCQMEHISDGRIWECQMCGARYDNEFELLNPTA